jgi:transketolase
VQRDAATVDAIARGGYVLRDAEGARAVIIATGSEVAIALDAQAQLAKEGVAVRVVSMPSTDVFDRQDAAWKQSVLPKGLPRVAIEAGVTAFWHKYVGLEGAVVGIDRYGESAPAGALFKFFGLTADKVAETVRQVL